MLYYIYVYYVGSINKALPSQEEKEQIPIHTWLIWTIISRRYCRILCGKPCTNSICMDTILNLYTLDVLNLTRKMMEGADVLLLVSDQYTKEIMFLYKKEMKNLRKASFFAILFNINDYFLNKIRITFYLETP